MADVIWVVVIVVGGLMGVLSLVRPSPKKEVRTVKGLKLTPVDWSLLGDIAVKRRVSQSALIATIVSDYLNDRVEDKPRKTR